MISAMDKNIILQILTDHLEGQKTVLPDDVDMAAIARLANIHQVDGIVYKQCGQPPLPPLARAYAAAMFYYANRSGMLSKISSALTDKMIPFFTVKGPEIAKFYPVPALRTMSDCDIVVPAGRLDDAVNVMRSFGFISEQKQYSHEWSAVADGLHFEVHDQLIRADENAVERQRDFFNDYMPYVQDGILDSSFHFLFLLMHLRKHLRIGGSGIRLFYDLAVMIRNCTDLNWSWIEEKIRWLEIKRFTDFCFSVTESWFSCPPPIPFERTEREFIKKVTEKILEGGLFGNYDESFQNNMSNDTINRDGGPLWWRRMIAFLRDIFLRYDFLKEYPGITYLDGRPWLLPVAWAHRLLMILKRKDKSSTYDAVRRNTVSKSVLAERKDFFHKMGIDR